MLRGEQPTTQGLKDSVGLMANYDYKLDQIVENHASYVATGEVLVGHTVDKLLRDASS